MVTKVRVFLDVDGVLNGVGNAPNPSTTFEARGYRIMYSLDTAKFIRELAAIDGVEILWLTTWEAHDVNNEIGRPMGLPHFDVIYRNRETEPGEWWKLPLAQSHHTDQLPLVWLDDDLSMVPEALAWTDTLPHVLAISPNTRVGLTVEHHNQIREFVEAHT